MDAETRFSILYTHQKLKKHKSWKDGFLVIKGNGNTILLYDENNYPITSFMKQKKHQYVCGAELECAKFLIQIENLAPLPKESNEKSDAPNSFQRDEEMVVDSKIPSFKPQKRSNPYTNIQHFVSKSCKKPFSVPKKQAVDNNTKPPSLPKVESPQIQTSTISNSTIFTLLGEESDNIFSDVTNIVQPVENFHPNSAKSHEDSINIFNSHDHKDSAKTRRKTMDVLQLLQTQQPFSATSNVSSNTPQPRVQLPINKLKSTAKPSQQVTSGFTAPKQNNLIQDKLLKDLFFASREDLKNASGITRNATIPVNFSTVQQYCDSLIIATREYINLTLMVLSKNFHDALRQVNLEPYTIACNTVYSQDNNSKNCNRMANSRQLTTYLKRKQLTIYCEATLVRKAATFTGGKNKAWLKKNACYNQFNDVKKKTYLQLPYREASSAYNKNDIWVVSSSLNFSKEETFVARSAFFGPSTDNLLEIEFISGCYMAKFGSGEMVFAIHAFNASAELSSIQNIEKYVNERQFPLLPHLLNNFEDSQCTHANSTKHLLRTQTAPLLSVNKEQVESLLSEFSKKFNLNQGQFQALESAADMLSSKSKQKCPLILIHGVFGSGKSFLLSIIILFFSEVAKLQPQYNWKILLSSTTNVAVDRVLSCLLNLEFTDICRVGCFRKISHDVLPYSIHTKDRNEQIKELQSMLSNKENSQTQRQYIRKSLDQVRKGITKQLLDKAFIVGATCASTTFSYLSTYDFPIVIIDECTQITEPHILLPLARFSCQYAMLVGDPNQLPPTIEGVVSKHTNGLEQTLFNRLQLLKYEPIKLRKQYRCHPDISKVASEVFYNGELLDGVGNEERPSIVAGLRHLVVYDLSDGMESRDEYSGSFSNARESKFVTELINMLLRQGVAGSEIGVIALYKAQVNKVKQELQNLDISEEKDVSSIQISTVDAFQGAEKSIIILSCVRSTNNSFVDAKERLCVALTRGKNHLLIVGHLKSLQIGKNWHRIIQLCGKNIQTPFQFRNIWNKKL